MAKETSTPAVVQTDRGNICFTLTRKRVKNLNLRIRSDGTVAVSAPHRVPRGEIDRFVREKAGWIEARRPRVQARLAEATTAPSHSKEECLALFQRISDEIFPSFSQVLNGVPPKIKVREMKTLWGSCNIKTRCITINSHLADKPLIAVEYVIMHEYVHFIYPNHQAGFHAEMARRMPDYIKRRRLLRGDTPESHI